MENENYNESNYEYNVGRIRQHGFPDTKNEELRELMQKGENRILLEFHSAEHAGAVRAIVHVEKADSGAYFPNRYQLELKRPESQYARRQFFQIQNFKGHGNQYDVPWKMGVNLLRGGQVLNTWLQDDKTSVHEWRGLDFSQRTNAGYGYVSFEPQALDVAKKLEELPIQEKDKNDLRYSAVIRSIEMGNRQAVHLDMPGNPVINLRANVGRRDLDIIKGGQVISIERFGIELAEMQEERSQLRSQTPSGQASAGSSNNETRNEEGISQAAARVPGAGTGSEVIGLGNGKQASKNEQITEAESSLAEKSKKVLTGNLINPHPSNHQSSKIRHGM